MRELFDLASPPGFDPSRSGAPADPRPPRRGPAWALAGLRARWLTAAFVAAGLTATGVAAVIYKFNPSFAAEALLEVEPTVPHIAFTDEQWRAQSIAGFYNDYIRTVVQLARRRQVMENAVGQLAAEGVPWLPPGVEPESAADHLRARLNLAQVRDTHLLSIRFEDGDASLVAPVVNAVAEAVIASTAADAAALRARTRTALGTELERLKGELDRAYGELDSLSPQLGSAMLESRQNPFYERVNTLEQGMTKLLVARSQAAGQIERAALAAEALRNSSTESDVNQAVDADVAVRDARVMLGRLTSELEAQTSHLSGEHPDRAAATRTLDRQRTRVAELEDAAATRARTAIAADRAARASELELEAQASLAAALQSEALMVAELGKARRDLAEHGRTQMEARRLRDRAQRLLDAIGLLEARLQEVLVESRAHERIHLASRAVEPLEPQGSKRQLGLIAAGTLALMAGVAAALGRELLDERLRREGALEGLGLRATASGSAALAVLAAQLTGDDGRRRIAVLDLRARKAADGAQAVAELAEAELVRFEGDLLSGWLDGSLRRPFDQRTLDDPPLVVAFERPDDFTAELLVRLDSGVAILVDRRTPVRALELSLAPLRRGGVSDLAVVWS